MPTGRVDLKSDLIRKNWLQEGFLEKQKKSFWSSLTGKSSDNVVIQKNDDKVKNGHTLVLDYDGKLTGMPVKGKTTVAGTGESKLKFSNKINIERMRFAVDNGDKFDAKDIDNLAITEHQHSRGLLADLFHRIKDQYLFDTAQGIFENQPATHILDIGTTFSYNTLLDIEKAIKTGTGFSTGSNRMPLPLYQGTEKPMWLLVVDADAATMLKKDSNYQTIMYNGDVRGSNNRLITGVIGKIGHLIISEAPSFAGTSVKTAANKLADFDSTSVEASGLRQYNTGAGNLWTGMEGFNPSAAKKSRCLLLGAMAINLGFGKMPDYKFQPSPDFGINSESACEVWWRAEKIRLKAEHKDYEQHKVADIDYGVIAVDITIPAP